MFHLGGVFLLNVLLRPRVPGYCVVGSPWWLGSLGLNLPERITLGQTWVLTDCATLYRRNYTGRSRDGEGRGYAFSTFLSRILGTISAGTFKSCL